MFQDRDGVPISDYGAYLVYHIIYKTVESRQMFFVCMSS